MNLLAYGGSAFVRRHKIGEWPGNMEGALQSGAGLQGSALSLGAGRLDARCFLIARQRQNAANRGGYAFTLLLDPDAGVWTRWGWNAPRLLAALFAGGDGPGMPLLTDPDRFDEPELQLLFQSLVPPTSSHADAAAVAGLRNLWVRGAAASSSAFYLCSSLGLDARPPLDLLADAVDGLPVCFRYGGGFLLGGDASQAKVWGVSIVFDTETPPGVAPENPADPDPVWQAWQRLSSDSSLSTALQPWAGVPAWQWPEGRELVLERLRKLAELTEAVPSDDHLEVFSDAAWREGPLASQIHDLAAASAARGSDPLTESATRYLVTRSLDRGLAVDASVACRMDEVTIEAELRGRGLAVWEISPALSIPAKTLWDVARVALSVAAPAEVPVLLLGMIRAWPDLPSQSARQLAKAAAAHISPAGGLQAWTPFRFHRDMWPALERPLSDAAMHRAKAGAGSAVLDYLWFRDPRSGFDPSTITLFAAGVAVALESLLNAGPEEQRRLGRDWLETLAASPLRLKLPLQTKRDMAVNHGGPAWQPFLALVFLFDGLRPSARPPISPAEKDVLRVEFRELAETVQPRRAPLLAEIVELIDKPEAETVEALERLEPPDTDSPSFPIWVAGLRMLGARNATTEAIRMSIVQDSTADDGDLQNQFVYLLFENGDPSDSAGPGPSTATRGTSGLLSRVFRGGRANQPDIHVYDSAAEDRFRKHLSELLNRCVHESAKTALNRAVNSGCKNGSEVFADRYARHRPLLDSLMRYLTPRNQARLLSSLELHRRETFSEDCLRLVGMLMEPGGAWDTDSPYYDRALAGFLSGESHRQWANEMANVYGVSSTELLQDLAALLKQGGGNGDQS